MSGTAKFANLVDMLNKSVSAFGSRPLFGTLEGGEWNWTTFAEFGRMVDAARGGLAALGVKQGDAVAMIAANRVEWAVCAYATYGLGAKYVPMYESQLAKDWKYIIDDCGAKVLVVSTKAIYDQTAAMVGQGALEAIRCMELPADDSDSFESFLQSGRDNPADIVDIDPSWICGFHLHLGDHWQPQGGLAVPLQHRVQRQRRTRDLSHESRGPLAVLFGPGPTPLARRWNSTACCPWGLLWR